LYVFIERWIKSRGTDALFWGHFESTCDSNLFHCIQKILIQIPRSIYTWKRGTKHAVVFLENSQLSYRLVYKLCIKHYIWCN
jgi:hypothetical protein